MMRRSMWMLALTASLAAVPTSMALPACAKVAQVQAQPEATRAFQSAYMAAIALQGALATGDWADAQRRVTSLRTSLADLQAMPGLRSPIAPINADASRVAAAVASKDLARASTAAYDLVGHFVTSTDQVAWAGMPAGGGGGAMPGGTTAMDHVEEAYQAAATAQLLVARGDSAGARLALRQVKHHLDAASNAGGADPSRIAELRLRVDGIDATLGTERAQPQARALVMAFADVFRGATGGGGGGPTRPTPFKGDVVPRMGSGQGAGAATSSSAEDHSGPGGRNPDDITGDRPNQSGRQ